MNTESDSENQKDVSVPQSEETDTFYKIHSAPLPPRSPSATSSSESKDSEDFAPEPESLADRIMRRKLLDEEWNNRFSFNRKNEDQKSPEPIIYRKSTLDDHHKKEKVKEQDTDSHHILSDTSVSTIKEETFEDKLQFFRRVSLSSPPPTFPVLYQGKQATIQKPNPNVSPKESPVAKPTSKVQKDVSETSSETSRDNETILKSILSSITVTKTPVKQPPQKTKAKNIGLQCDLLRPPKRPSPNCNLSELSDNTKEDCYKKRKDSKGKKKAGNEEAKKRDNKEKEVNKNPKQQERPKKQDSKVNKPKEQERTTKKQGNERKPEALEHKEQANEEKPVNHDTRQRKYSLAEIDWVYIPRRYSTLEKPEKRWNLLYHDADDTSSSTSEQKSRAKSASSDSKAAAVNFETKSKPESESSGFKIPNFNLRGILSKSDNEVDAPKNSTEPKSSVSSSFSSKLSYPESPIQKKDSIFDFSLRGVIGESDDKSKSKEDEKPLSTHSTASPEKDSLDEKHPFFTSDYFNIKKPDLSGIFKTQEEDTKQKSESSSSASAPHPPSPPPSSSSSTSTPKPAYFKRSMSLDRRSSIFKSEHERQMYLREIKRRPKVYNEDIKNSKTGYEREIGVNVERLDDDSAKWHDLTASERARLMNKQLKKGRVLDKAREEQRERNRSGRYYRESNVHSDEETRTSTRRSSIVDDRIALYRSLSGETENFQYSTLPTRFTRNTKYSNHKPDTVKRVNVLPKTAPIIRGRNDNYFVFKPSPKKAEKGSPKPIRRDEPARSSPKPERRSSTWGHEWAKKHNLIIGDESSSSSSESLSDHVPKSKTRVKKDEPIVIVSSRRPNKLLDRKQSPEKPPQITVQKEKTKPIKPNEPKQVQPKPRKVSSSSSNDSSYSYTSVDSNTNSSSLVYRTARPVARRTIIQPPPKDKPKSQPPPKEKPKSQPPEKQKPKSQPPVKQKPKMAAVPGKSKMNTVPSPPREIYSYSSQSGSRSVPTNRRRRKISADDSWIRHEGVEKDESLTYYQDLPEDFQPWNRRR